MCATCPAHLILDLITVIILAKHTSHEAPHYAVFSLPPLPPSEVQIFSSAQCSETPYHSPYRQKLVRSIERCIVRQKKAEAWKQELCPRSKVTVKETRKPKT
jgi:hypothetical protein